MISLHWLNCLLIWRKTSQRQIVFSLSHSLERKLCSTWLTSFTDLLRYRRIILTFSCTVMTSHSPSSAGWGERRGRLFSNLFPFTQSAPGGGDRSDPSHLDLISGEGGAQQVTSTHHNSSTVIMSAVFLDYRVFCPHTDRKQKRALLPGGVVEKCFFQGQIKMSYLSVSCRSLHHLPHCPRLC